MQPQEVLQALVNSMEKTLRKEKSGSLAGQTPSLNLSQQEEAGGQSSPGRGRKDLKEREAEPSCIARSKGKRKGVPPKTSYTYLEGMRYVSIKQKTVFII
jgi:hypothetical protein